MKTVTIPFDLEMARKIHNGEMEGKIAGKCKTGYEIVKWNATGNSRQVIKPLTRQEERTWKNTWNCFKQWPHACMAWQREKIPPTIQPR